MDKNTYKLSFPITDNEEELRKASRTLVAHCKNKTHFSLMPYELASGGIDSSDYTNRGLKRAKFSQKKFNGTKFINSAAAGSVFSNCEFKNCMFQNANFQECTFSNKPFIGSQLNEKAISNCNFNNSLFIDDFFIQNVLFKHSVFQNTSFINGRISDTVFYSSTLEDATFSNVSFENVRFSDLNIDYCTFENIKMKNVILPFSQICYAFGLLTYLLKTQDEVYITSITNEKGYISRMEFLKLLPEFIVYYKGVKGFFPLANIYLAYGDKERAREVIFEGILNSVLECDFRQIKYLCKLIYTYSVFSFHERKRIYDYMNSHISFADMNPILNFNYQTYKHEIECLLLDNNNNNIVTSEIDIATNISYDNQVQIGVIISALEQIIENGKSEFGEHSITCRHNSDIQIAVIIQDVYESLKIIIPNIYYVLMGILALEEKAAARKRIQWEKKHQQQLDEIELERTKIRLQREKLALQKETAEYEEQKMQKENATDKIKNEILRKNIQNNNITVRYIKHLSYGNIPETAAPEIITYCSKEL